MTLGVGALLKRFYEVLFGTTEIPEANKKNFKKNLKPTIKHKIHLKNFIIKCKIA